MSPLKGETADSHRTSGGWLFLSHDSKYILYQKDKGGDENYNIYAVNPADEAAKPRVFLLHVTSRQ
jgi:hypothetical protein